MTDRKKLIEPLDSSFEEQYGKRGLLTAKHTADYLLDNGVSYVTDTKVGDKWTPSDERLPEHDTDVLCWYEYFRFGNYNRMYHTYGIGYCINGNWGGEVARGTKCRVLAWMPLPEPPKEE